MDEKDGVKQNIDFLQVPEPMGIVLETFEEAIESLRAESGSEWKDWEGLTNSLHTFSNRNFMGVIQGDQEARLQCPVAMNRAPRIASSHST